MQPLGTYEDNVGAGTWDGADTGTEGTGGAVIAGGAYARKKIMRFWTKKHMTFISSRYAQHVQKHWINARLQWHPII